MKLVTEIRKADHIEGLKLSPLSRELYASAGWLLDLQGNRRVVKVVDGSFLKEGRNPNPHPLLSAAIKVAICAGSFFLYPLLCYICRKAVHYSHRKEINALELRTQQAAQLVKQVNSGAGSLQDLGLQTINDAINDLRPFRKLIKRLSLECYQSTVEDIHLQEIGKTFPNIEDLTISLYDSDLVSGYSLNPHAFDVTVFSKQDKVTDQGLKALKKLKQLKKLQIEFCNHLTVEGLEDLFQELKATLRKVTIIGCEQIAVNAIKDLAVNYPIEFEI